MHKCLAIRYAFIYDHRHEYPLQILCRVIRVNRSSYYKWLTHRYAARTARREKIDTVVRVQYLASNKVYGSPRIAAALKQQGYEIHVKTVARSMKRQGLKSKVHKKFRVLTTDSKHNLTLSPNLLSRDFHVGTPHRAYLSDITYIRTNEGWLYLASIIDLGTRAVIGWHMDESLDRGIVIKALKMAVDQNKIRPGAIFHSDRGVQYASHDFRRLLVDLELQQSMSGVGDCWDNAPMESFWGSLKNEHVYHQIYATRKEATIDIEHWIRNFYNSKRLHSSLGYQTPLEFYDQAMVSNK